MREFILAKATALLESKQFSVTNFVAGHSCFDLAATRGNLTLLIKAFDNVDSLREEHALELKKMVSLFNAVVVVLGNKTKASDLRRGVIYERYSLPTLSIDSFKDLLNEKMPSIKSFKGKEIVALDADKIRERRKELGLTLGELASKVDTTIESVHRYEKGHATSLQVAEKLEKALKTKLVEQIDLFKGVPIKIENVFDESIEDEALGKVHDLGLKLALFKHAPFRASSPSSQGLVISKGTSKQDVKRKAVELRKSSIAFGAHGMVIANKTRLTSVEHVPIVDEDELTTLSKFKDLMFLLKKRES